MSTDAITFLVVLCFWPLWLGWEMYLLWERGHGVSVKTISMTARDRGWHLNSIVYAWCGLAAHFWWNAAKTSTTVGAILFWVLVAALLVRDGLDWNSDISGWAPWKRWSRWPLAWAILGVLAGHFLFPQVGMFP